MGVMKNKREKRKEKVEGNYFKTHTLQNVDDLGHSLEGVGHWPGVGIPG